MAQNTAGKQLSDLLVTRGYDPEMLDSSGKPAASSEDAEIFSFEFNTSNGTNHGTVVVMLSTDKELTLFNGDNVGRGMDSEDKTEWYEFQHQLKNLATRNFMTFSSQNINRLKYSMQGQAALKEGLFESWNGTKNISWNGGPDSVRLMIKHKRSMGVNEARFRQVESLFVETAEGERYKLPFRNMSGGRAMVEHVRQGGKPYDMRGTHIANIVEELNVLSRFRRASKGRVFEGDTVNLVNETNTYYESMSSTLKGLSSGRGYNSYFESWNPADITEQDVIIENIKTLFVQETIDSRIEQALPILARIHKQGTAMKEASIFEAWADRLMEGTWTIPNTPEQQQELIALLSKELPVGADAINATEQLYSLFGDDVLFDQLQELAAANADADAREIIIARLKEVAQQDPGIAEIITALETPAIEAEPEEVDEGRMKDMLWNLAEKLSLETFVGNAGEYGMGEKEALEFWNSVNGEDDVYNDSGLTFDDSDFEQPDDSVERMLELSGLAQRSVDGGVDEGYYKDPDADDESAEDQADRSDDERRRGEEQGVAEELTTPFGDTTAPQDLGSGAKQTNDTSGGYSVSNAGGTNNYNALGTNTSTTTPTVAGYSQTTNHTTGNKTANLNQGPLSVSQTTNAAGAQTGQTAKYDLGLAKASQTTDATGKKTNNINFKENVSLDGEDKYSALSGQYGHSGKLQKFNDVEEDVLSRLKQLSGMIRTI
jgi:hypothetical protein